MYICLCKGVTDTQLREAVRQGACTYGHVRKNCRVGTQCGKCTAVAQNIVETEILSRNPSGEAAIPCCTSA